MMEFNEMALSSSQDVLAKPAITQVLAGYAARSQKPLADVLDKPNQATPSGKGVKSSEQALAILAEQFETVSSNEKPIYDEPDARTQKALAAYNAIAKEQKREQFQQMLSVDLFA